MPSRLDQLRKKQAEIDAQIKAAQQQEVKKQRQVDHRRKLIVGEMILRMDSQGQFQNDWLIQHLDRELLRKTDRTLFGLDDRSVDV